MSKYSPSFANGLSFFSNKLLEICKEIILVVKQEKIVSNVIINCVRVQDERDDYIIFREFFGRDKSLKL